MRCLLVLPFLLLAVCSARAGGEADSLEIGLKTATGPQRVDLLNRLSSFYQWLEPDRSLRYADQAFEAATRIRYREGVKYALRRRGDVYAMQGNHTKALAYLLNSLKVGDKPEDDLSKAHVLSSIGHSYTNLNEYRLATDYLQRGLDLFRKAANPRGIGISYRRLGNLQQLLGDQEKALQYYRQSLKIMREINDPPGLAFVLDDIGSVERERGNYSRALARYQESLALKERTGNKIEIAITLANVGEIRTQLTDYANALRAYQRALEIAGEFSLLDVTASTYLRISELYRKKGDSGKAYENLLLHTQIKDDLFDKEKLKQLAQMQSNLESLTQQNEIKVLREKQKLQESTLRQNQSEIAFWTACFGLVSLLIVVVVIGYRIIRGDNRLLQDQNKEIKQQKEEIETRNAEIGDNNQKLESARLLIEEQNLALRQANNELEAKVDERTRQLTQAYVDLLTVNQDLDTLIYRASHDIKGPLATLIGLCNVAQLEVQGEASISYFSKVETTARNMDRILMRLLSISDIRLGHVVKRKVDLEQIIHHTLQSLIPKSERKQTLVYVRIQPDLEFNSDEDLLRIILQNLLENALYYSANFSRQDSYVQVNVTEDEVRNILIHIKDNGVGINDNTAERVFDMFFRGNEVSNGAGLGLYIAKIATEKLNGTITLKNKARGETLFEVKLPR
ncbi:MAG: tetratricopeptide repeat protein [Ferruginibacter sp.]|nr:tetratricopeptide repeat protein [Cytophagales bacterium]